MILNGASNILCSVIVVHSMSMFVVLLFWLLLLYLTLYQISIILHPTVQL